MKIFKLTISCILVLFIVSFATAANAYDVVIDPGHGGDEQNRGGPAFTTNGIGSELAQDASAGQSFIYVSDTDHFTLENEDYITLQIGAQTVEIDTPNTTSDDFREGLLTLSSPLSNTHTAGEDVTVQDFLV